MSNILASISPQYNSNRNENENENVAARYRSLFSGSSEYFTDEKHYKQYLETRRGDISSSPQKEVSKNRGKCRGQAIMLK